VQNRIVVAAGAVLVLVGVAGCSSSPKSSPQPPGSLPTATAQITINGKSAGTTRDVACTQDDWMHTILTGDKANVLPEKVDGASGVTVVVDTKDSVNAKSVQITNVNGFTGTVWENNIGKAQATIIGSTWKITGTAQGENANDPNKEVTATFEIKANC
jgi:hypothetical protein